MLADAEDVEAEPVGELDLLDEPPEPLPCADRPTALRVGCHLAEAVDPELHRRWNGYGGGFIPRAAAGGSARGRRSRDLEGPALHDQLLLVRRDAHDGAGPRIEHAGERVARPRQIRHRVDVVVHARDLVSHARFGRRPVLALLRLAELAPADGAVAREGVLERLGRHRTVLVRPADRLPADRIGAHGFLPRRFALSRCKPGTMRARLRDTLRDGTPIGADATRARAQGAGAHAAPTRARRSDRRRARAQGRPPFPALRTER